MRKRTSKRIGAAAVAWKRRLLRCGRVGLGSWLALICAFAVSAPAQKQKNGAVAVSQVRVAEGRVVDKAKQPVNGAVVYLENPISLDIKSYLTTKGGRFHFNQIAPQTDYEVWAEQDGVQSKHKFISQFSNHTKFDFTLKLTPQKKKILGVL